MLKKLSERACENSIKAIACGDNEALSVIYDKMHRAILSVAWSVVKNTHDAEDVLQNTLCEILRCAKSYGGGNAHAWILSIARNQAYNLIRKNQKEAPAEVLSAVSADTDAEARYIYLEALSTLSDKEREVIVLKVYCKCKHKEIAEILDITAAASEKLYQRGVGKLKKYYD